MLSDIHGNVVALEAALKEIARSKPDVLVITGDLVLNGPRPAEVVRADPRARTRAARCVVQGNTDIAVADFDYAAAFPWMDDVPAGHRAAAEWAHDQLADERARLPAPPAGRAAGSAWTTRWCWSATRRRAARRRACRRTWTRR